MSWGQGHLQGQDVRPSRRPELGAPVASPSAAPLPAGAVGVVAGAAGGADRPGSGRRSRADETPARRDDRRERRSRRAHACRSEWASRSAKRHGGVDTGQRLVQSCLAGHPRSGVPVPRSRASGGAAAAAGTAASGGLPYGPDPRFARHSSAPHADALSRTILDRIAATRTAPPSGRPTPTTRGGRARGVRPATR